MGQFAFIFALALFMALALLKDWKRPVGTVLIIMLAVIAFFYRNMTIIDEEAKTDPSVKKIETVRISYSGDKKAIFNDPEFREMLKKQYGIVPDGTKIGINESDALKGIDGIWFSTESEKRVFDKGNPDSKFRWKNIYQTPEVLYAMPEVTKILMRMGIAEKKGDVLALTNMRKLREMEAQGKTWESVGLSDQYGKIRIISADPEKDNPASLFDRFVKQSWSYPLISGYENLIVELWQTNPGYREKLAEVRVLFPEPTILIPHPFVALTPKGMAFLAILEKPDVRTFIGNKYGLRSAAGELPAEAAKPLGLPRQIISAPSIPSEK